MDAAGEKEIAASLHVALEGEADAQDEDEINGEDGVIDGGKMNACLHQGVSWDFQVAMRLGRLPQG